MLSLCLVAVRLLFLLLLLLLRFVCVTVVAVGGGAAGGCGCCNAVVELRIVMHSWYCSIFKIRDLYSHPSF